MSTPNYGLITGRVSSIAIDPDDVTGNHVFIGTTGGGVWTSQNAASSGNVVFTSLTDSPAAFDSFRYGSISIGAITVQPGATGVVLAGTGDPNDALDSYYGAGILRSTDGGKTWTAIPYTSDQIFSFMGEGFAGFAWSTVNPQLVVAAVSQSYEGALVFAPSKNTSYAGLYYSTDSGKTWSLARITDGPDNDVQGPLVSFAQPNGNSATAVVWNPIRHVFIAAVRFHGYYQSVDGITWTRMASQPGISITPKLCPSNRGFTGSIACPVFRGALAVNPETGDTFAWTVDLYNQDQGLWQDTCGIVSGKCASQTATFTKQWNTSSLQTKTALGSATIANGDYDLTLAAVPSQQDTILFAGTNDLWRCSLAVGCQWRNTTNSRTCMSARVAPYQHAIAWNPANPREILIGNDSGLWRSMDGVSEENSVCSSEDADHFQNLNSGLGSLAEIVSMALSEDSRSTFIAGLGVNGTAGIKDSSDPADAWPQILSGQGGPVAINRAATPQEWFVNAGSGVSIHRCSQSGTCTPQDFGNTPVVDNSDVSGDGLSMTAPAPFLIDPLDPSQLLVGTCRIWRGPVDKSGWTNGNAISSFLDGISGENSCRGDGLVRTIAALPIQGGAEVIYVGMYGARNGGSTIGGHIFKASFAPGDSSPPSWSDLTFNPVENDQIPFNYFGMDVSSIFIDPHDPSGNTVYVTIAGVPDLYRPICVVYRSTDGGATWNELRSNLPSVPANGIVIDPGDADTAYIATDNGVFSTRQISTCVLGRNLCWSVLGVGLPDSPVTQMSTGSGLLTVGTYGRGIWQIPLWSQSSQLTSALVDQTSLTFPSQAIGKSSSPQIVRVRNTGNVPLTTTGISVGAPFSETDDCRHVPLDPGATCSIQITFLPDSVGPANGRLTIDANILSGQIRIDLAGTGISDSALTALPGSLDFGQVAIGSTSKTLPVTLENSASQSFGISSISATAPFSVAANPCGGSIAGNTQCALSLVFSPTQSGAAAGTLTVIDDAGTQTVQLLGVGATAATDEISESSVSFAPTPVAQKSAPENIALSNKGDLPLNAISISSTAGFEVADTCGGSLGPRAQCVISVVFAPSTDGPATGMLTILDALRTQTVRLSGIGLRAPIIEVDPAQVVFPSQLLGQKGPEKLLKITNSGGSPLANLGFQITGVGASNFSLSQSTCTGSLSENSSCSVQIAFVPGSIGLLSATFTVSASTAGVSPVQVAMSGIGQGKSGIMITPEQMTFTQAKLGEPSAVQVAKISNVSGTSASELTVSATKPFSLTQNTCGSILDPGASCSTGVVFTPSANALVNGTLSVASSAFADPAIAVLAGAGGAAGAVQVRPELLAFGSTGIGLSSAPKRLILTNNSQVDVRNIGLSVSAGFTIAGTSCGEALEVANSCTVDIAFAPVRAGLQDGNLSIASESIPVPLRLPLSGMGFDFTIGAVGQTTKTISSGQTAAFTFSLSPLAGSAGTFTFSCAGLPSKSKCSFNPESESVPANATGSVTVNISTGPSPSTAAIEKLDRRHFAFLPLVCLLAFPLLTSSKDRIRWLAVLMITMIGLTCCTGAGGGGSGGSAPTNNGTQAGTYSIVVNATANGVSHNTTFKLVVD